MYYDTKSKQTELSQISFDARGNIIKANSVAENMFLLSAGDTSGLHINSLISEPLYFEFSSDTSSGIVKRKLLLFDVFRAYTGVRKDGITIPISVMVTSNKTVDSSIFTATIFDRTKRKQSEELREKLFLQIGHDIRNQLAIIKGALELILCGAVGQIPTKATELIDRATGSSENLAHLILNTFNYESFTKKFEMEPLELGALVQCAVQPSDDYTTSRFDKIHISQSTDAAIIYGSEVLLLVVLVDLLSESITRFQDEPKFELSLQLIDDFYCVIFKVAELQQFGNRKDFNIFLSRPNDKIGIADIPFLNQYKEIHKLIIEFHDGSINVSKNTSENYIFCLSFPILKQYEVTKYF